MKNIDARKLNEMAKKAVLEGYDNVSAHYAKLANHWASKGEFEIKEPQLSWIKFGEKHAKYFKKRGFSVSYSSTEVWLCWADDALKLSEEKRVDENDWGIR